MKLPAFIFLIIISLLSLLAYGQQGEVASLTKQLESVEGNKRVDLLNSLSVKLRTTQPELAADYSEEAYQLSKKSGYTKGSMISAYDIGFLERAENHLKRAARFAEEAVEMAHSSKHSYAELRGLELLVDIYRQANRKKKLEEAELKYKKLKSGLALNKLKRTHRWTERALNLSEAEKTEIQRELDLTVEEKLIQEAELARLAQEKAELEVEALQLAIGTMKSELEISEKEREILQYNVRLKRQQFWKVVLGVGLAAAILITFILVQYYRQKRIAMEERAQMQRQLMMQERMASLGQMTAGIAHEIKNPLNFVINFAEGSSILGEEFEETLAQNKDILSNDQYGLLHELVEELNQNSLDILNHGKRADRIIKSMMEHARSGAGQPQLTNVNSMLEDNLNLAYHSYLAAEPGFHVDIQKDLDQSLPEIKVIPKALSRVMLNILNNACYAVRQKQKELGEAYKPAIMVKTGLENDRMVIKIHDNGPGIPPEVRGKIFTPFFTTKPTGSGNAGLGLSISYDIIVQEHEGKLAVESEPGEFTEFTIELPL